PHLPAISSSSSAHARVLPSFPTRRSSDLFARRARRVLVHPIDHLPAAAPISIDDQLQSFGVWELQRLGEIAWRGGVDSLVRGARSEEHTSELQSPYDLVCRLLLEKKKI